jgi:hypothetical protein
VAIVDRWFVIGEVERGTVAIDLGRIGHDDVRTAERGQAADNGKDVVSIGGRFMACSTIVSLSSNSDFVLASIRLGAMSASSFPNSISNSPRATRTEILARKVEASWIVTFVLDLGESD